MEKTEFKNETLEEIVKRMIILLPEFERRRKGHYWRSIITNLGEVFKEDKNAVKQLAMPNKTASKKKSTGAKVTRFKDLDRTFEAQPPCDGCPGSAAYIVTEAQAKILRTKKATQESRERAAIFDLTLNPFTSEADIIQRFEENPEAMKAWAEYQGINIPSSVKKAATMAKYIFEHFNTDSDDNKS